VRFWDSSALVPLLVEQRRTRRMTGLLRADSSVATWWAARVECDSAIARLEREGQLSKSEAAAAWERLDRFSGAWQEIQPAAPLRDLARRLLRVHALRAADALQLAAAIVASEQNPPTLQFVCLDERLTVAAEREGFKVLL